MQSGKPRKAAKPRRDWEVGPTRLVADAMLGSLARKLRAFGLDTSYYKDGDDPTLLLLAAREGRVILTSDRALSELSASRGIPCLVVEGARESARITSLRSAARASGIRLEKGAPRCSVCNGDLHRVGKPQVVGRVPTQVSDRHWLFFQCDQCGRIYWKGSHWKKLRWLEKRLV